MSQFRTSADIQDEILEKAGESPNGNSAYETFAMTYLNKAHQAIIGGGSFFNLRVDEPWVWARAKKSIILELEPAITGSVTVTNGSKSITFSSAPTSSVEGWHFKIDGESTVFKITQHTASSTSAAIDSAYLDDSGSKNFRAFKLDYSLAPTYIIVDSYNDKLDLIESGSTQQTITLTHGTYTPAEYIAHVVALLNALPGTVVYTGSYDSVTRLFTLTSDLAGMGTVFKLIGATGTNQKRSALPSLGLDMKDHTGAASYVGIYALGGISRLIEPFKIFRSKTENPMITSIDPINMEMNYPLWNVREQTPKCFAKIEETNDGLITVRFNSYPPEKIRVEVPWIPVPHDLQDNAVSIPLVPRKDIDVLIHSAAAFILFDKEDTKFKDVLALAEAGLEAMQMKNRKEMGRTDSNFGQIIPRQDKICTPRKQLRYGYEVND